MRSEFLIPAVYAGFLISGLLVAFEPATCLAQAAEEKPTAEIDDPKNPLIPEFRRCDVDKDGLLTEAEYQHRISFSQQDAHREFVIFDADGDAKITLNEFLTVPIGQAEEYRGTISDPVIVSARTKLKELTESWPQSDQNADGLISGSEYSASNLASRVPGLEATPFADWDLNHDGGLSRDEVARVLDVAWGVCVPDGTMLRDKVGRVVDWTTYLNLKKDANGVVTRNAYYQALGPAVPNPED